jgi:chorismate lyase
LYAESPVRQHPDRRPPRWLNWRRIRPPGLPQDLRPWLLDPGSLTRHLIQASGGDFQVEVLAQRWRRPTLSEARLLDIDTRALALIREVILRGRGQPWVYGRSVMPAQCLRGDLRRLRKLRSSSLGALLFRYPQLQRTPFELARIDARSQLPARLRSDHRLWARRSRFELNGRALIVSETFLPAFDPDYSPRRF